MSLTDTAIRNAKPGITPTGKETDKPYKLDDAGGLYLEVAPAGGKWWRLKYRYDGKEKRPSLFFQWGKWGSCLETLAVIWICLPHYF